MTENCETCRFWSRFTLSPSGQCRVKSPRATKPEGGAVFPTTHKEIWCGEFELPKPTEEKWLPDPDCSKCGGLGQVVPLDSNQLIDCPVCIQP